MTDFFLKRKQPEPEDIKLSETEILARNRESALKLDALRAKRVALLFDKTLSRTSLKFGAFKRTSTLAMESLQKLLGFASSRGATSRSCWSGVVSAPAYEELLLALPISRMVPTSIIKHLLCLLHAK